MILNAILFFNLLVWLVNGENNNFREMYLPIKEEKQVISKEVVQRKAWSESNKKYNRTYSPRVTAEFRFDYIAVSF